MHGQTQIKQTKIKQNQILISISTGIPCLCHEDI